MSTHPQTRSASVEPKWAASVAAALPSAQPPKMLRDCATPEDQLGWVKRRLDAGETLTDTGLWMAGLAGGWHLIHRLRRLGTAIEDVTFTRNDRSGRPHPNTRGWRKADAA